MNRRTMSSWAIGVAGVMVAGPALAQPAAPQSPPPQPAPASPAPPKGVPTLPAASQPSPPQRTGKGLGADLAEEALGPIFEQLTPEEAMAKAEQASRVWVVFWTQNDRSPEAREMIRRATASTTVRAFLRWHAVTIKQERLPAWLDRIGWAALKRAGGGIPCVPPAVLVMLGDDCLGADGTRFTSPPGGLGGAGLGLTQGPRGTIQSAAGNVMGMYPTPVRILFTCDFSIDCLQARDPLWANLHALKNHAPQPPPEREPMSSIDDGLAPVVRDPAPEERRSSLDRLEEARAAVRDGDLHRATGLYTWLWERGAVVDPAFGPARMSAVVEEMGALAVQRPGARERFEKVKAAATERLLWADYSGMHEWFALGAATADESETLEYLDMFVNDPDEGTMIPPTDALAFSLLSRRERFGRAWELPAEPVARARAIADRLTPRLPSNVRPEARADFDRFVRRYLVDEGCRLYAACLGAGREEEAARVAKIVLEKNNSGAARLALVTTAMAVSPPQARPVHLAWLEEAKAEGPERADLRARVTMRLAK